MKKRRLLVAVLLFCCMAGCGKNGENDDTGNMEWTKVQEQGDSERTQAAGEGTETEIEAGFSGDNGTSGGNAGIIMENGEVVEGVIAEQSFEVELDDWGTVMFASIAPADGIGGARFVLAKDGAVVYTFPESRTSDEFVEVSAVSFLDYNEDGRKDVIVLTRYRNGTAVWSEADVFLQENSDNMFYMDYPDMADYRHDAPTQNGSAFYSDSLLEEWLLTQRMTDTVADIKGTWLDYVNYVDSLNGYLSIDSQFTLLAENRDIWVVPIEFADEIYRFTVMDMDYDGCLEVIVANWGGTGHYTYSRFYEIGKDGKLKELETSFAEGDSQPDIIAEQMTVYHSFSPEGMRDHYIVYDEIRETPDSFVYRTSSLCMINDYILETPLASQTVTYGGEDYTSYTVSKDCSGNMLTQEEFENFPETYYDNMGFSKETIVLQWIDVSELEGKSDEEVAEFLKSFYQ